MPCSPPRKPVAGWRSEMKPVAHRGRQRGWHPSSAFGPLRTSAIVREIRAVRIPAAWCGIRPTAHSAPRLSSALRAPPLCRCAERTAVPILRLGWSAARQTFPPPRGTVECRGEVKEEPAGRGTRVAALGRSSRLANHGGVAPAGSPNVRKGPKAVVEGPVNRVPAGLADRCGAFDMKQDHK